MANKQGSKWVHRLTDVDLTTLRAVGANCGPVSIYYNKKHAKVRCRVVLREHERLKDKRRRKKGRKPPARIEEGLTRRKRLRKLLQDRCERCGFVPEQPIQLAGHHKNGRPNDNRPENVATVCHNCHSLIHAGFGL